MYLRAILGSMHIVTTRVVPILILALAAAASVAAQQPAAAPEPALAALARFLARAPEPLTRYRAIRRIEASNARFKKHGWLVALTELSPEHGFTFRILEEGGSASVLARVLRPVLAGEQSLIARGDAARAALTRDNYEWLGAAPGEAGQIALLVRPKRRDVTLVEGTVAVTAEGADLVAVSGRLSKTPSFWTRRVDVVRRYGRIAGVRVPLRLESVAQVLVAGRSSMSMTYQYEMVNGVAVAADEGRQNEQASAALDVHAVLTP
jgi:hypothetical protein